MADQYVDAVRRAKAIGSTNRASEFEQCIKGWESHRPQRSALHSEMFNRGVFSSQAYVVLEVGNAGWGSYHYAYLWVDGDSGHMTTDMMSKRWGKRHNRSFNAERLTELLNDTVSPEKPTIGVINTSVDDGLCFFVTIQQRGYFDQFAVYAPSREGKKIEKAETIVNRLQDFLDSFTP